MKWKLSKSRSDMHYCAEKQMQSHRVARPPKSEAMSFTSAWGKAVSQKGISLWTKWRQGLCNLKPKSNQRSVNGPTEGCWPAFVCVFPSSVPGHPEAFQGGCLPCSKPITCLCVGQLCFSSFDPAQWNLSIWQGVSRAYLLGWQLGQQLAGATKLHPAAVGTTDTWWFLSIHTDMPSLSPSVSFFICPHVKGRWLFAQLFQYIPQPMKYSLE